MPKTKRKIHLSDLQISVIRVLWARGEATTSDVVADLGPQRGLAHTTVATLLTRLEKRGLLAQRRDGRALVYRALVSEPEVQQSMVADLVATLFRGDPAALVAHLVREDDVKPGDVAKIRARLEGTTMTEFFAPAATWLVTYLAHSTVLFGVVWLIDKLRLVKAPSAREFLWRGALVGALVTASVQSIGIVHRAPLVSPRAAVATVVPMTAIGTPILVAPPSPAKTDVAPPMPAGDDLGRDRSATSRPTVALHWTAALALVWFLGALLGIVRLGALAWLGRREIADRRPAGADFTIEFFRLCKAHGVKPVSLSVAPALAGPISLLGGEVVVPPWALANLGPRQRRAMFAHELAHHLRRDPQWLLATLGIGTLLWVQPLHGLARRRLAHLAELEADAWAARAVDDPRALAECLAACAENIAFNRVAMFGAAMASDGPLVGRVDRLLNERPAPMEIIPLSLRAVVVAGLVAAAVVLPGCNIPDLHRGHGSSMDITISNGGDLTISVDRPGYEVEVTTEGEVTFVPAESDIATVEPGGEFTIAETLDGVSRAYKVTADRTGALTRVYSRDGEVVPRDAAADAWLAAALPRLFRESGFDAEARVARLLARGGPTLVLGEIDLTASDHAKAIYLGKLIAAAPLDSQQLAGAYASAAKIESDFELAELLTRAMARVPADPIARDAWLNAAARLGSDFELRRVLESALDQSREDPGFTAVVVALGADRLGSDFELRSLLEKVVRRDTRPELASAYLTATTRLGSDFDRRTALVTLIEGTSLDATNLRAALDVTAGLGSDFDKRTVLLSLAEGVAADPDLNRRYRDVARDLSDFDRGEALRALDDAMGL